MGLLKVFKWSCDFDIGSLLLFWRGGGRDETFLLYFTLLTVWVK